MRRHSTRRTLGAVATAHRHRWWSPSSRSPRARRHCRPPQQEQRRARHVADGRLRPKLIDERGEGAGTPSPHARSPLPSRCPARQQGRVIASITPAVAHAAPAATQTMQAHAVVQRAHEQADGRQQERPRQSARRVGLARTRDQLDEPCSRVTALEAQRQKRRARGSTIRLCARAIRHDAAQAMPVFAALSRSAARSGSQVAAERTGSPASNCSSSSR